MIENTNNKSCGLQQAQRIIEDHLRLLPSERVELGAARHRLVAADIVAAEPMPSFAEATRDGYVPAPGGEGQGARRYQVVGEIAAGRVQRVGELAPGTAWRIMTGGCLPVGSERVVPYEECVEKDGEVCIAEHLLRTPAPFIRRVGSVIAQGERLVAAGVRLQAEHLELFSSCGVHSVAVAARPAVGFFCTGSELKLAAAGLKNGQKVSSNAYLLAGILATFNAVTKDFGIVGDTYQELSETFARVIPQGHKFRTSRQAAQLSFKEGDADVLISTGGMGPGKYDLVEKAFVAAGGRVIFNALALRPGKSILFGSLGRAIFFGLPGPPYAVRTLLHELVGPALLAMQGAKDAGPKRVQAHLLHPVEVKDHNVLQLQDGMLHLDGGRCFVRLAGRLEIANCHILLHPGHGRYAEGDLVDVHLVGEGFSS